VFSAQHPLEMNVTLPFRPVRVESVELAQELDFTVVPRARKGDGESSRRREGRSDAALYILYGEPLMKYIGRCQNGFNAQG
jgi:hypothetical protein